MKPKRTPVSLRVPDDMLEAVDQVARMMHNSRTGTMLYLCEIGLKTMAKDSPEGQ